MQAAALTVGTTAVQVPVTIVPKLGMRLLARSDNSGNVFLGTSSAVTASTGILIPKGLPGELDPWTVPPEHFNPNQPIYLIGSAAAQVVDWSAQ